MTTQYDRTGTAIVKNCTKEEVLFTNTTSGRHALCRDSDGTLWAVLYNNDYSLNEVAHIYKSTDNGFTWTEFKEILYSISGEGNPKYDSISILSSELYDSLYLYCQSDEGTENYAIEQLIIERSTGDAGTWQAISSTDLVDTNVYTVCDNLNYVFILYTISNVIKLRVTSKEIGFQFTGATDNEYTWSATKYDACADNNNNVYMAWVHSEATTDVLAFKRWNYNTNNYKPAVTIDTAPSTSHGFRDIAIARDGYGTLCVAWGEVDNTSYNGSIAWRYAISKDMGLTWTKVDMSNVTGYSPYKDAKNARYITRTDVIGGLDGGFLITYTQNRDAGTATQEQTEVTCAGDTAGSLNNKYWWLFTDTTAYYIWYNVNSAGSDPGPSTPSGGPVGPATGVEVAIATGATATAVATASSSAIDALADFVSTSSGSIISITHATGGSVKSAQDGNTTWSGAWDILVQGAGTPRSLVRHLSTTDGVTYTLGDQKDITNTPTDWNICGAAFFDITSAQLMSLNEPGLVRCAYQINEYYGPIHIDQDILAVGPYPIGYPSNETSFTVETAGADELLITFEVVDTTSDNTDFYTAGMIGNYTTEYLNTFIDSGTSVRILKYEPLQESLVSDIAAYDTPTEVWANIFIDPLSYGNPQIVQDTSNSVSYVEKDIRKVYLPPDLHLSRSFILNDGNYLKRTVWIVVFGGNEYELTQVVPRFINNQITHYDCNAYVIGPSYNPFTKVTLPSET